MMMGWFGKPANQPAAAAALQKLPPYLCGEIGGLPSRDIVTKQGERGVLGLSDNVVYRKKIKTWEQSKKKKREGKTEPWHAWFSAGDPWS